MTKLTDIKSVLVERSVLVETQKHLRYMGKLGFEGFVLWIGTASGDRFHVLHAMVPSQRAVRSREGAYVVVGSDELHRLNVFLYTNKLTLLAQVHSHPGEAYHSSTDDAFPIATVAGSFSLVVPDFAIRQFSFVECAVYRLSQESDWCEVEQADVQHIFTVVG